MARKEGERGRAATTSPSPSPYPAQTARNCVPPPTSIPTSTAQSATSPLLPSSLLALPSLSSRRRLTSAELDEVEAIEWGTDRDTAVRRAVHALKRRWKRWTMWAGVSRRGGERGELELADMQSPSSNEKGGVGEQYASHTSLTSTPLSKYHADVNERRSKTTTSMGGKCEKEEEEEKKGGTNRSNEERKSKAEADPALAKLVQRGRARIRRLHVFDIFVDCIGLLLYLIYSLPIIIDRSQQAFAQRANLGLPSAIGLPAAELSGLFAVSVTGLILLYTFLAVIALLIFLYYRGVKAMRGSMERVLQLVVITIALIGEGFYMLSGADRPDLFLAGTALQSGAISLFLLKLLLRVRAVRVILRQTGRAMLRVLPVLLILVTTLVWFAIFGMSLLSQNAVDFDPLQVVWTCQTNHSALLEEATRMGVYLPDMSIPISNGDMGLTERVCFSANAEFGSPLRECGCTFLPQLGKCGYYPYLSLFSNLTELSKSNKGATSYLANARVACTDLFRNSTATHPTCFGTSFGLNLPLFSTSATASNPLYEGCLLYIPFCEPPSWYNAKGVYQNASNYAATYGEYLTAISHCPSSTMFSTFGDAMFNLLWFARGRLEVMRDAVDAYPSFSARYFLAIAFFIVFLFLEGYILLAMVTSTITSVVLKSDKSGYEKEEEGSDGEKRERKEREEKKERKDKEENRGEHEKEVGMNAVKISRARRKKSDESDRGSKSTLSPLYESHPPPPPPSSQPLGGGGMQVREEEAVKDGKERGEEKEKDSVSALLSHLHSVESRMERMERKMDEQERAVSKILELLSALST
uniref:Polycystin cation channel PKD1/PKD2 domain-containing protein n=1 Tax=Palpitomonas bilix TaxID=652834 RepID=A0A7S3GA42_9EUKA|mmetsp:Transcript_39552/g.101562  ORF Transcript_39552/g.101562 Transcript_39552/m.101562 type:complete len:811 (+) Transcript_39552:219-2651(+)